MSEQIQLLVQPDDRSHLEWIIRQMEISEKQQVRSALIVEFPTSTPFALQDENTYIFCSNILGN